jgi:hypothetical protein
MLKSLGVQVPSEGRATALLARQRCSRHVCVRSKREEMSEKELMLECDEVEAEISVADFDNVKVQLEEESECVHGSHN